MSLERAQRDGREVFVARCDGVLVEGLPCVEEAVFTVEEMKEEIKEHGGPRGWVTVYDVAGWRCLCRACEESEFPHLHGGDFETRVEWLVRDLARHAGPDDPFLDLPEEDVLRFVAETVAVDTERGVAFAAAVHEYWKQGQLWRAEA